MKGFMLALALLLAVPAHADEAVTPDVAVAAEVAAPEAAVETGIVDDEDAVKKGLEAAKALANKAWFVVLGFLLMLTTYLARKFNWLAKVPKEWLPWVTVAVGAVGVVGESLYSGAALDQAIANTGTLGATAVFLWEAIFKHLLKKKPAA